MGSRKYLVGVVVVVLLIWGPIDHSWPAWFLIRTGYLITVPLTTWFLLGWVWKFWQPDEASEDISERVLAGLTGGVLVVLAIIEALSDTHIENTMSVRPRDGMEDLGDYVIVQGPDWGVVVILIILAGFAFWLSLTMRKPKQ
jgi:hypothetical protein